MLAQGVRLVETKCHRDKGKDDAISLSCSDTRHREHPQKKTSPFKGAIREGGVWVYRAEEGGEERGMREERREERRERRERERRERENREER